MEEKKKQEFEASTDFEIEESNAMKVLKGTCSTGSKKPNSEETLEAS